MKIAILLYPGFTALDAIGPYETLGRLPGAEPYFVAERPGPVRNDSGHTALVASAALEDLTDPDVVVVPGGPPANLPLEPGPVTEWLRATDPGTTWTTSVCTGSLILAAAGLLEGRRATSHWLYLERLAEYGAEPAGERVVTDGKYVTAAGVSAGIDMGLALAGRIAGDRVAQSVQLLIEYDPRPPYDAGSPRTAPADLVAEWRSVRGV
ncbi:DJ-1/PfpI family protein [Streptomyces griseocarneus]|uniref:DJ-1/PfpI family protein n=1 Tax=Streptomyces griseocarneus TaxID=51201 RepID=UPI00167DCF14|nr:DJ-1/PfpI family protein [Streptomyces griseocarneus]MBZ6472814.1 DJ-1/PfpI family protein [Streptomyces griseocarneus]GHG47478.1 glutamine amidotransferase [Streptomyces griseocarneus]